MLKKIFFLAAFCVLVWDLLGILKTNSIETIYYTNIESNTLDNSIWWEVIRSKEDLFNYNKYLKLDLKKLSGIDFSKNAIVLSNGRKINKIIYRKSKWFPFLIYDYSGIAYLGNKYSKGIIYVYLIDADKKLFVDRHYSEETQYVIE